MFSKVFLAQTSREMKEFCPNKTAYMALHFSPYSAGLSNVPQALPKNSLLLLDDSMPINNHRSELICDQLKQLCTQFSPSGLLLDFQSTYNAETADMASRIVQALPCPVAVTEPYARNLRCPVFLAPPPVNKSLEKYLAPWQAQGIFLEIAREQTQFTVTEKGCKICNLPNAQALPLINKACHCHYKVEIFPKQIIYTLQRTKADLADLAEEAYGLGVSGVVGLYQELSDHAGIEV